MQDMTRRHEYDNLMKDNPIYDGTNMELADWQLQIEKLASLPHSQAYKLATTKSTITPNKILKRLGNNLDCHDIKRKLEEVHSLIATEAHAASDLIANRVQTKHYRNTFTILLI